MPVYRVWINVQSLRRHAAHELYVVEKDGVERFVDEVRSTGPWRLNHDFYERRPGKPQVWVETDGPIDPDPFR